MDQNKARETLHNDLSRLADRLKDLKDATVVARQTGAESKEPAVTVTELRTVDPILVQTETKRGKFGTGWERFKNGLEAVGIAAVVFYTIFAYHQWQAMNRANDVAMSSFRGARIYANEQLKQVITQTEEATRNFRADQRAWIGVVISKSVGSPIPGTLTYKFKNHGRSPATDVVMNDNAHVYGEKFPASPFYAKTMPSPEMHSKAPVLPGQENEFDGTTDICRKDLSEIIAGTKWCYTYGIITYKDEFGAGHTTHFCFRHGKPINNAICDTYNDAN